MTCLRRGEASPEDRGFAPAGFRDHLPVKLERGHIDTDSRSDADAAISTLSLENDSLRTTASDIMLVILVGCSGRAFLVMI